MAETRGSKPHTLSGVGTGWQCNDCSYYTRLAVNAIAHERGDWISVQKVAAAEPSRGAPDAESKKEQLDRLHSMASGDETWDLSPNDLTALRNLLDGHVVLLEALRVCQREIFSTYMDEKSENRVGSATKAWEMAEAAIRRNGE